jgi:DNA-binding response OmpR family regulator
MPLPKLLLVHYDPKARVRFRSALELGGFEVEEAKDGATAMARFIEMEPDAVLIEAMIPKVSGFEVCQDIKKTRRGRQIPVILMTSVYKTRKYRDEAIHTYGADEYIELPMDDAQLVALIHRTLPQPAEDAPVVGAGP